MPDLTPNTREEHFLNGDDLTPETRREYFYAGKEDELIEISGDPDANKPQTREEWFIQKYRGSGEIVLEDITITENGEVTAPSGKAYKKITTDVPLPQNAYLLKSATTPTAIASFTDGEEMVMPSLKISIEPQQSGSGDPSPTNIRPISGWTEAEVSVVGKNLLNPLLFAQRTGYTNMTVSVNNDIVTIGPYDSGGRFVGFFVPTKVNSSYTISFESTTNINAGEIRYKSVDSIVSDFAPNSGMEIITNGSTIRALKKFILIQFGMSNGDYASITKLQVEEDSTATTYEPYNGHTTTIPFTSQGQSVEVYGGVVDVVNGVVTVTHSIFTVNQNSSIFEGAYGMPFRVTLPPDIKLINDVSVLWGEKCNMLTEVTQSSAWGTPATFAHTKNTYNLYFKITNEMTDVNELKAFLQDNPIYFVYELATPQTIQINPTSIKSLDGVNNVWADCGDVAELEYWSKEV